MKQPILIFFVTIFMLALFTFLFMGVWEFVQTPFFHDASDDFNEIVFYRIHCTLGDMLILFEIAAVVSLIRRGWKWLLRPGKTEYLLMTLLGVFYTAISEYINVHVRGSWGYSELMPLIPAIEVGVVPILQWLILPSVILTITKNYMRGYRI